MKLLELEQEKILEPELPARIRIDDAGLDELAESIRELGLMQPLTVREHGGHYEVIAGHRRLLATRKLGMPTVQCFLLEEEKGEQAMALRLHENLYRVDLTPIEEAAMYAQLYETLMDTDKVAALCRRSRDVVERRLALLNSDDQVLHALTEKQISAGVAEQLNKVEDADVRHYLLGFAIKEGATVEKVRNWRKSYAGVKITPNPPADPGEPTDPAGMHQEDPYTCWLCGSSEEPEDLRVRMVHATCERMARRQAEANAQQEVTDGAGQ